jgi:hypothetical protein
MAVEDAKPAEEWSDIDVGKAAYDLRALAGPQVMGAPLIAFRHLCENPVTSTLLYKFYSSQNALPKVRVPLAISQPLRAAGRDCLMMQIAQTAA